MATYGMTNVEIIESTVCGMTKTYLVYADTKRFGKHEIMAQFPTKKEAEKWLKENGVKIKKTVEDMINEQIEAPFGKIQIGNMMFRNITKTNDGIWGYSKSEGLTKLDRYFAEAYIDKKGVVKTTSGGTYRWQKSFTIKFGNACTW